MPSGSLPADLYKPLQFSQILYGFFNPYFSPPNFICSKISPVVIQITFLVFNVDLVFFLNCFVFIGRIYCLSSSSVRLLYSSSQNK